MQDRCGPAVGVFIDETGDFSLGVERMEKFYAVAGIVVPSDCIGQLREDFALFKSALPRDVFVKNELKGSRLGIEHYKLLLQILFRYRDVILIPLTVVGAACDREFLDAFPKLLRGKTKLVADEHLTGEMRDFILNWSARVGNLSYVQLFRLFAYAECAALAYLAVLEWRKLDQALNSQAPIMFAFDRVGKPRAREEQVLQVLVKLWLMTRSPLAKEELETNKPAILLYDSKDAWQIQLADCIASMWGKIVRDWNNYTGHLTLFRDFHRLTIHSSEDPLGMIAFGNKASLAKSPEEFGVFVRIATDTEKLHMIRISRN